MNQAKDIELIEAYLLGELSPDRLTEVETRLLSDQDFARLYRQEKLVFETIGDKESQAFLDTVNEVLRDGKKKQSAPVKWMRFLSVAASIVLLAVVIWLLRPDQLTQQEIISKHFEPYPMMSAVRGEEIRDLNDISEAYNAENWSEVIRLSEDMQEADMQFYRANALIKSARYQEAIDLLERLKNTDLSQDLYQISQYHLAIAHIGAGQFTEAKVVINSMIDKISGQNPLRRDIEALLSDLE